jgi:hypothetical protein
MGCCDNTTDFVYPMLADVYYPIITQGPFGEIKKEWVFDRTISCNATPIGGAGTEQIKPDMFLQYEDKLIVRSRADLRITSKLSQEATTNIIITNIRFSTGQLIYKETAGPRANRGTIYEIGTLEPFTGPFNSIEYYKMLWRRTESQAVGD